MGQTYYWRIDEVNPGYANSKGDVWSLRIISCLAVDDMESYCEDIGCWISETWIDNYTNLTGSYIVLGEAPDPIHGGSQSMEFWYDNDYYWADYYYSETERAFGDPCDWSGSGAKALSLYFYGDPGNDADATEQMYLGLEDISGPDSYAEIRYGDNGEDMNDIKVADWKQWIVSLSDYNDAGMSLSDVNNIYIGFGDRSDPVIGGSGIVFFDDIEICSSACIGNEPAADLTGDCAVDYKDLKVLCDQWLNSGSLTADLYPDNKVDYKDFAILGNSWLEDNL
ncbi:MAG: hypothetical protein ACYSWP_09375 [Planctomycetota bacterium]